MTAPRNLSFCELVTVVYLLVICLSTRNKVSNLRCFLVVWISDEKEFVAFDTFNMTYTWQTAFLQIDVSPILCKVGNLFRNESLLLEINIK